MLNKIVLYSPLMPLEVAQQKYESVFGKASELIFSAQKIANFSSDFTIIYILTGGVERIAQDIITNTMQKVLLIALENDNSLATCYELKAFNSNAKVDMLYVAKSQNRQNIDQYMLKVMTKIDAFIKISQYHTAIISTNFGIIGGISDWLINSQAQPFPKEFEINPVEIRLTELMKIYRDTDKQVIEPILLEWNEKYNLENIKTEELEKSASLFYALYEIVKKYDLSAVTIKCFDLLPFKVTACLALAELNDIGIIAGCEGDTQALFTLFIAKIITKEVPWMANISDINIKRNTLQLAHCTVPTLFLSKKTNITLDTHMESDLSLAICGDLPLGKVTIIRIGKSLSQHFIMEGEVTASNMGNKNICRTQTIIKINESNNWYDKLVGNHQILVKGHHKREIRSYLNYISD